MAMENPLFEDAIAMLVFGSANLRIAEHFLLEVLNASKLGGSLHLFVVSFCGSVDPFWW